MKDMLDKKPDSKNKSSQLIPGLGIFSVP